MVTWGRAKDSTKTDWSVLNERRELRDGRDLKLSKS